MARYIKRTAESWTYVLFADRALSKDQQTVFTLRPMNFQERAATMDKLSNDQRTRQEAAELALAHIITVANFPVGEPRPWPAKLAERQTYLDQMDDDDILELGNEIYAQSRLGTDAETIKNFLPPAPTSGSGGTSADLASTTVEPAPKTP